MSLSKEKYIKKVKVENSLNHLSLCILLKVGGMKVDVH